MANVNINHCSLLNESNVYYNAGTDNILKNLKYF